MSISLLQVIAATNRPDTLDPALLRSGRLDRKIELPHPNELARVRILQIHSRKMTVDKNDVNFAEIARATDVSIPSFYSTHSFCIAFPMICGHTPSIACPTDATLYSY